MSSTAAAISDLAQQVTNVFEAITFVEFILEEAAQMYVMAISLGIRFKAWNSVLAALSALKCYHLPLAKDYTQFWGWWAGYSYQAFRAFWLSVEYQIMVIEEVLTRFGITPAPCQPLPQGTAQQG